MKNRKPILTPILLFGFALALLAGDIKNNNDPEAKKMLDKVFQSLRKLHHFRADFILNVENSNGKNMGSKKGVFYSKDSNYKIIIQSNQEVYSDGKTIWTYDKNTNEVQISNLDTNQITLTPDKLFTNFYDKSFSYQWNGKSNIRGKNVEEIVMIPQDTKKSFFKIILYVDMLRKIPLSAKIFDKNGLCYIYIVTKFDKAKKIGSISFNKSNYPNVQIVDLR